MAWISSTTAVFLHSAVLFTAAFYLARDASIISEQPFVIVVGQAMLLKPGTLTTHTDTNGLLVVLMSLLGLTDLVQLVVKNVKYFESILPARLFIAFVLAAWAYNIKSSMLHNDVTFVFLFVEVWFHFVLYNVVRQEKHDRNQAFEKKLEEELLAAQQGGVDIETLAAKLERQGDI